ncbi:MAG: cation-translocating P-type ATPase [Sandaracinaceae bacterium]
MSALGGAWNESAHEIAERLGTDLGNGLEALDASRRLIEHGPNILPRPSPPRAWLRFLAQFADPLVGALLGAAIVAAVVAIGGEGASWVDVVVIVLIVVVNAVLGFVQERRAERAVDALDDMVSPRAKVLRDGAVREIDAAGVVPGDVLVLHAGDRVAADARLTSAAHLAVDESALTGESSPVAKRSDAILDADTVLADRENMVLSATTIARGEGRAIVVATGARTEIGRIGTLLRDIAREPTPLERRLARLGKQILLACLVISALVFVVGLARQPASWVALLLVSISLAVAAIPEGLPAITTVTLALGTHRMARRGAIVRKLTAVETLGSATVICSDKTGTLTENAMTVRAIETSQDVLTVTGQGYAAEGHLERDGKRIRSASVVASRLVVAGLVANDAHLDARGATIDVVGDPTEASLLVLGAKLGLSRADAIGGRRVVRKIPFDSARRRMSVIVEDEAGARTTYVKGSPDEILSRCARALHEDGTLAPLDEGARARVAAKVDAHARAAMRVLALAERSQSAAELASCGTDDDPEADLVWLGLVAIHDPPRVGVREAIDDCRSAGVEVVMITGDHRETGVAIARELGIYRDGDRALEGAELTRLDDGELDAVVDAVRVYARVSAEQKLRIVRALKRRGHVVAMTGDGVNDAPALIEAAIGVAMGKVGTDVARQSAEMVLSDDNFTSIVEAIREGRAIFGNIQKFIFFLGSSNAGLVAVVTALSFFDALPQLTPLQLLWINLVTNGLPALALGVDPPERSQMRVPPRPSDAGVIGTRDILGVLVVGVVMGAAALVPYGLALSGAEWFGSTDRAGRLEEARAMAFALLALSPLFHAHNCRSPIESIASLGLFSNRPLWLAILVSGALQLAVLLLPPLYSAFRVTDLDAVQWGITLALAALPIPVVEALKLVARAVARRGGRRQLR